MRGLMIAVALAAALFAAPWAALPAQAAPPGPSGPAYNCSNTGWGQPTCTCKGAVDCFNMGESGVCKGEKQCSGQICTCDWRNPRDPAPLKLQPPKNR